MMNLAEYRSRNGRLADFLPWAALVGEGVILNKDGTLQRTARFRGPDLDSAVAAELVAVAGRLNNAFRRLGSGWAIFVEAQRRPSNLYPESAFPDAASALVDAERKADFEEVGAHFESSYFLTFTYLPPPEDAARAEHWLYEGRDNKGLDPHEVMRGFADRTDRLLRLIEAFMPECAWLDDAETLTYLHSCVSTRRHRVRVPETPIYLDALLADQPLTGGLEPRLGGQHLRILTIVGFPTATTPGLLDELNRLAFPYRWSTRAIRLDKTDATKLLTKIRRQWFAKRKSIAAILKEVMTNEASVLVDTDAANEAADADLALQELGADFAGMAYVTATVTVWDANRQAADEKLRLIEKVIQGRDFTAMPETINAVDAWLGSLPGHVYANVRQPPISTLNLAHMIPLSAVWAGPERDEHLAAPPLLFGKTEGSTPFRFSLHVGDVGHTLVVGPTGAGKSVLLALMALQFRRYQTAWFMEHRIREAMCDGGLSPLGGGGGTVEVDETAIGRVQGAPKKGKVLSGHSGWRNTVLTLVERGGSARSFHTDGVRIADLKPIIHANIERETAIMTDELPAYKDIGKPFASHDTVKDKADEYVRREAEKIVTTNTVEGYFSIFKRGMKGVYQHCGEKHLHRYLAEFDFRYSNRVKLGISDTMRAAKIVEGAKGKRLFYRRPDEASPA